MENGEPFVTWGGILMMLELSVDNWVILTSFLWAQLLIFCIMAIGSGHIWQTNVDCTGNERRFGECFFIQTWGDTTAWM